MPVYKYKIFDTLTSTYWLNEWDNGVYYSLEGVVYRFDELQQNSMIKNQFEIHRIKIGEMQTIE